MSYPGNSSLAPEIQKRILATFEQTLELAEKGNEQEALLGCDFILRLDPLFDPARKLQSRLEHASGAVEISDLRVEEEGPGETSFSDLDNVSLDTQIAPDAGEAAAAEAAQTPPSLPPLSVPVAPAAQEEQAVQQNAQEEEQPEAPAAAEMPSPASEAPEASEASAPPEPVAPAESVAESASQDASYEALASNLEQLIKGRKIEALKQTLAQVPDEARKEPRIAALLEEAQEAAEAEPYVRSFLEKARNAKSSGDEAEAVRLLAKARALDPEHPGIAEVEAIEPQQTAPEEPAPAVDATPSADTSSAPPAAPAPDSDLDLAGGVELSSPGDDEDEDPRIRELLKEGQAAFDQSNYQGAIDAWSRIFLINIDHPEANRRIEIARKMKEEGERKIEQLFHEALEHSDAGENEEAIAGLKKVLELAPGHMAAREALEGLEAGETPQAPHPAESPESEESDSDIDLGLSDLDLSDAQENAAPLKHQILVPPEPGEEPVGLEESAPTTVAVKSSGARRRFFAIGLVVLAAVVVAGWFLYNNRDRLFHNTSTTEAQSANAPDPLARAKQLANQGKTDLALAMLRRMPPSDPHYSEAQVLIAQWEAAKKPQQPTQPAGPSSAELATREHWLESARAAIGSGEFLVASEWLAKAASIAPLQGEEAQLKARCDKELAPIGPEINLFHQGEWELALPRLWRVHQTQPDNKTVTRLIVDSYYNLGVRDLQRQEVKDALSKFREGIKLAPSDVALQRLVSFCETYRSRTPDLLYQIFVKYLPFR